MADWKLLSFYTASSGSAHRLDSREDGFSSSGAPNQDVSMTPSQEIFCTGNNISSCVGFLNQVRFVALKRDVSVQKRVVYGTLSVTYCVKYDNVDRLFFV